MPQIRGAGDEAVVLHREYPVTKQMRKDRLARRVKSVDDKIRCYFFEYDIGNFYEWFRMIKKAVSKDERAWFLSRMERRAKTVSERISHAGENPRVFGSTDLILA